jgi:hypothetical protein
MTFNERMKDYIDILEASAKLLESSKPPVESIIKSIDEIIYTDTAKEFRRKRREGEEKDHERLKAICRDKIRLVEEAMKAGISETGALQILFSEFALEPAADATETMSAALEKAAPLIATTLTPRTSHPPHPFPFPGEIPSPEGDFPDEAVEPAQEE